MYDKDKKLQKNLQIKLNGKSNTHQNHTKDDFDEWKRLEKWQIGRRNFC